MVQVVKKPAASRKLKHTRKDPVMALVEKFHKAGDTGMGALSALIDGLKSIALEGACKHPSWKQSVKALDKCLAGKGILVPGRIKDTYDGVLFISGVGYTNVSTPIPVCLGGIQV